MQNKNLSREIFIKLISMAVLELLFRRNGYNIKSAKNLLENAWFLKSNLLSITRSGLLQTSS